MPVYPLEKITTPTLVLHGKADELMPFSHADAIVNKIPQAKILEVQDGGHLFCATHHHQVIPAMFEFLKQSAKKLIPASPLPGSRVGASGFSALGQTRSDLRSELIQRSQVAES